MDFRTKYEKLLKPTYNKIYGYPFKYEGFTRVPEGWYTLVDTFLSKVDKYLNVINNEKEEEDKILFLLDQIKEKFGGLRIYHSLSHHNTLQANEQLSDTITSLYGAIDGIIEMTEAMSFNICQECGLPGKGIDINDWIYTLCEKCYLIKCKDFQVEPNYNKANII